jgi:phosphatidylglycerol---prolipoprotein diacylglyceryl transferase
MFHTLLSLPSPPSPIIFEAGPFTLRYYGLFIALGIAVGTWLTSRELARRGYDGALALESLFFIVPLGLVGARAYYVARNYDLYATNPFPEVLRIWNGGLEIYGALAGGFLGVLLFGWYRSISPLAFADAAAPGLVLGQAIGRWGDYFNQELFGRASELPWAIRIAPDNRPAQFADDTSFHPTFLYESLWGVLLCLVLLWIARRYSERLKAGDVFLAYVILYSAGHFLVETLRPAPDLFVSGVLASGCALVLLLRRVRLAKRRPNPVDA